MSINKSSKFPNAFTSKKLETSKRIQNLKPAEKYRAKNVRAVKGGKAFKNIKAIHPIRESSNQNFTVKNTKNQVKSQVQTKILIKPKLQMKQVLKSPVSKQKILSNVTPLSKQKVLSNVTVNNAVAEQANVRKMTVRSNSKMSKHSMLTNESSFVVANLKQPSEMEKTLKIYNNNNDWGDLTDKLTDHDRRALYKTSIGRRLMNNRRETENFHTTYYQRDNIMEMVKNRMKMVSHELESVKKRLYALENEKRNIEAIMFSSTT